MNSLLLHLEIAKHCGTHFAWYLIPEYACLAFLNMHALPWYLIPEYAFESLWISHMYNAQ